MNKKCTTRKEKGIDSLPATLKLKRPAGFFRQTVRYQETIERMKDTTMAIVSGHASERWMQIEMDLEETAETKLKSIFQKGDVKHRCCGRSSTI
jgi:hypothetical protein